MLQGNDIFPHVPFHLFVREISGKGAHQHLKSVLHDGHIRDNVSPMASIHMNQIEKDSKDNPNQYQQKFIDNSLFQLFTLSKQMSGNDCID